jgi:F-type H+-transporting ATPase subunit b
MIAPACIRKPAALFALLLCLVVPLYLTSPVLAAEQGGAEKGVSAAEKGEGGEHGGGGEGEHGPGKAVDYAKRLLNFGLLAGALVYLLRKPVGSFFSGRREQIATQLADLERARDEAKLQLKAYEEQLTKAAAEREKILTEFIADGEREKARILAEAEASAGRIKDAARLTIEAEIKAAKRSIREELADAAVELAEKKLTAGIVASDHERLINDYLTKVVELK